jgi:hypothetical protein
MARKVFFSFHYDPDKWRASQVRNMGALEGNVPCSDNDSETGRLPGTLIHWVLPRGEDEQRRSRPADGFR